MLPPPTRTDRTGLKFGQYFAEHNVYHPGVDYNYGIGNQDKGQPVISPTYGVVEYVSPQGFNGGLGQYIVIWHPWHGVWTRYLHLDKAFVRIGEKVAKEQMIGLLGDSGTTSAHCHFEVLNWLGLQFIKNWHRPYGRYPEGMSEDRMRERWLDPEDWRANGRDPLEADLPDLQNRLRTAQKAVLRASPQRQTLLRRLIRQLFRLMQPQ